MALPKRCVNNEIALKKINFRFLDKYTKVYFHDGPPTKRRTTKSYIIGGGQRRCCTRCRRFTASQLPAHKRSHRDGAASAGDSEHEKSVSLWKEDEVLEIKFRSEFWNSLFRHFTSQPGNVDHPSRINSQLLQTGPDEGRQWTILFATLLSRVETSIRNRPAWGLRKLPLTHRYNRYSLDSDVSQKR
ncbi:uncharacterized protein LOC128092712 [Culex pipiens pallens]|uniref:uncharacterized protein LOC128092712 n=1 Tax=Culex pipiens pallens TaxID=42434 RepID=UPI0022AB16E2|nr:uncharacterized protein LOC128092712 [Culex pipiens pallens]